MTPENVLLQETHRIAFVKETIGMRFDTSGDNEGELQGKNKKFARNTGFGREVSGIDMEHCIA